MSELEQLTQIIDTILGNDNDQRKQMENLLKTLRDKDFSEYVVAFTNLLKATDRSAVKTFCIVHIRKFISDFVDDSDSKWHILRPEAQKFLKDSLLELLKSDTDKGSRKVLCDFIGDLSATMQCLNKERKQQCSQEGVEWPELMQVLWGLLTSGDAFLMESSLRIMSVLFVHCGRNYSQYKDDLINVFKETLVHPVGVVSVATMEAIACYFEHVEFKNCKPFLDLIPNMLSQTLVVAGQEEDLGVDAIASITDILDTEPRMFKKNYKDLVTVFSKIIKSDVDISLKQCSLEGLILAVERLCKEFNEDLDAVKEVAELVFTHMITTDEDPDDEWLNPPEGYVENVDDEDNVDSSTYFGMGLIDRIIRALNSKKVLPLFSGLILKLVQVDNWRYQHSALMSLSQVGEFVDDISEFDPIIEFVTKFFQHSHAKVRYAALHVVGQSAEDCRPFFQNRFGKGLLEQLIGMLNDNTPRIVVHALNAMTNYLEECPKEVAAPLATTILEPCLFLLQNSRSLVKESATTVISNLAESLGSDFSPYWIKTAETIFAVLESTPKELKQLKAALIEALTTVGAAVGKVEFQKVAHQVIQKMLDIQNNEVGKMDPQTAYILSSWHRVASTLEEDFTQYLHVVMPSIFNLVESIVKSEDEKREEVLAEEEDHSLVASIINKQENPNPEEKGKNSHKMFYHVNTSESDDIVVAVKMMRGFAEELKGGFFSHVEKCSEILLHLLNNSENEEVRAEAAQTLPEMLKVVKASNHPSRDNITRNLHTLFIQNFWEAVWSELDAENMKKLVDIMMDIITIGDRCLDDAGLEKFSENILETLKKSEEKKQENNELYEFNNDEYDEDDAEMLEETNKLEDELHLSLAELIGTLFKVYKEQTLPLAKLIYTAILPKALSDDQPINLKKFGLFLIDDMIEHLGIELIPEEWPHLCQVLLKFATDTHIHLRHAAIYGIGCLGEKSAGAFQAISNECMDVLYKGLNIQRKAGEDPDEFGSMTDNIVASLGKIIKAQSNHIHLTEAIKVWVSHLPLRYDTEEGKVQHELLVDIILESNAALVFGESGENLPKTIRVLAEAIDLKATGPDFKKKVAKVIQLLQGNEQTNKLLIDAVNTMDGKLQKKLQSALQA